jgi:hypothetical protein
MIFLVAKKSIKPNKTKKAICHIVSSIEPLGVLCKTIQNEIYNLQRSKVEDYLIFDSFENHTDLIPKIKSCKICKHIQETGKLPTWMVRKIKDKIEKKTSNTFFQKLIEDQDSHIREI